MAYCEVVDLGGPFGKAWVRFTGPPPALCEVCRKQRHTKLCDFPTRRRHTCSRKLCDGCTTHVDPDLDYCPEHRQGPSTLFNGPQGFIDL